MNAIQKFKSFYTDLTSMQVDELSDLYSTNVIFIDPIASHSGIAAVENYFSKLLHNAKHCTFTIHDIQKTTVFASSEEQNQTDDKSMSEHYTVTWQMSFTSSKINKGQAIHVDGITQLKIENNKISFHRDYYDLGQMVYENVPLLGRIIKRIKRALG